MLKFSKNSFFIILISMPLLLMSSCSSSPDSPLARYQTTQISKNAYVIFGPTGIPDPQNRGFMNNPAFVITEKGVVLIDPGSSAETGKLVSSAIKRVTKQPVVAVINTHVHGDHWLGNNAVKRAFPGTDVYGHSDMIKKAADGGGQQWIKLLNSMTDGAVAGTIPLVPNKSLKHGDVLTFGNTQFKIHHTGHAHTHGDLMVEVPQEKVFFLGDIVLHGRIGRMDDGNFKGNIDAIDHALAVNAAVYVPGHGKSGDKTIPLAYRTYLETVYKTVSGLYNDGISDFEMKPGVLAKLDNYKSWHEYNSEVGRHVSLCYLEVEQAAF